MPELLLELLSEEIPARMQAKAAEDLRALVTNALVEAGLTYEGAQAHATPRRLVLSVEGLNAKAADTREERKGPRTDAPKPAIDGFLKSTGLKLEDLSVQDDKKGKFYVALIKREGRAATDVIAEIVPEIVRKFPWPKSMRWGAGTLRWVRPLQSILCAFDGEVVPFEIDGIKSGNVTKGHRFLSKGVIEARRFEDYAQKLHKAFVIVDANARAEINRTEAKNLAFAQGLELIEDEGLLKEAAGLVEWPVVLMGEFDKRFLDVPPEVIVTSIKNHQKCFALRDGKSGALANKYLLVANMAASDGGKEIVAGNNKVIAARLSDAKFFWDQDRKVKLEDQLPKLDQITFHAKLGTQGERVKRIEALAGEIAKTIGADVEKAKLAARLCKADLVTGMVGEFPELQGLMGRYYALDQGIDAEVADAIRDHYKPQGPSDSIPVSKIGQAVALADKLDTLAGFFAIDEKPTGSKDPFALRRAALGVVRAMLASELRVSLVDTTQVATLGYALWGWRPAKSYQSIAANFDPQHESAPAPTWSEVPYLTLINFDGFVDKNGEKAAVAQMGFLDLIEEVDGEEMRLAADALKELRNRLYRLDGLQAVLHFSDDEAWRKPIRDMYPASEHETWSLPAKSLSIDLLSFFADRLKVYLKDQGARHDLIDAVFALGNQDDLLMIVRRVEALSKFLDTDDGKNLLAGVKRAANILKIEEKKDGIAYSGDVEPGKLIKGEEKALHTAVTVASGKVKIAVEHEDFEAAMAALAKLRAPVDAFFEHVTVNDVSFRENRLKLLNRIRAATLEVADFSKIEG